VRYQPVDDSTLRVFAIGTVGVETLRSEDGRETIQVATPQAGHGTGFMVGSDGLVVTARHVVDGARHVVVRLPEEKGFIPARVVLSSEEDDVAVLWVGEPGPAIELAAVEQALRVRQTVFAIGYPLDPSRKRAQSAKGIVAGALDDGTLQLDIAVNPGNSGGPLVDENNQLVGMVVARGAVEHGVQGMGFAVPLDKIRVALKQASAKLAAAGVPKPTEAERRSAAVVDELVQRGALHVLSDRKDLDSRANQKKLSGDLRAFASAIDDPDLLAFVSGNLWNASLLIKYGVITKIGDTELDSDGRESIARDLREQAVSLAHRANEEDPSVIDRSEFVRYASQFFPAPPAPNRDPAVVAVEIQPAPLLGRGEREYGARAYMTWRWNPDSGSLGRGPGVAVFTRLPWLHWASGHAQTHGHLGASISTIEIDRGDRTLKHRFYVVELGIAHRVWRRSGRHLLLGLAWSPGYYESAALDHLNAGEDRISAVGGQFSFLHARTSLGLELGAVEFTTGVRVLSGPTLWFEALSLGAHF
jgi:S1-C subfamily serine protease